MAHIRQQLRDKARVIVQAAINRPVYGNRAHQIDDARLPCAVIFTDRDANERVNLSSIGKKVYMTIQVYSIANPIKEADDSLDDLCVAIENAFNADTTINATDFFLVSTSIDLFDEGERPIAMATLNYEFDFLGISSSEQLI
ncbi:hypothetical protein [Nitrosomonas sp. Nm34]|uniref:hypothetical protein n=1 Tax=Nitrosomonas sp. Nm34 TaxID=1881055 RepID=UPI0008EC0B8B|nr:hypothetical protein [Nitrosomonas sp. Nm34]SFI31408.1 hypothetical protein SAMN05428978_100569 [Nitrosomonas sp. Nm34]